MPICEVDPDLIEDSLDPDGDTRPMGRGIRELGLKTSMTSSV